MSDLDDTVLRLERNLAALTGFSEAARSLGRTTNLGIIEPSGLPFGLPVKRCPEAEDGIGPFIVWLWDTTTAYCYACAAKEFERRTAEPDYSVACDACGAQTDRFTTLLLMGQNLLIHGEVCPACAARLTA
jgi:hypothetical protein